MDIIKRQDKLQKEAKEVIEKLDLMNLLSKFGTPHLIGSASLGLMTWKDIDIQVVGDVNNEEVYWEIVRHLFCQKGILDLGIQDTRKNTNPNLVTGLYITIRYVNRDTDDPWEIFSFKPEAWKIDIWFTDQKYTPGIKMTRWVKDELDDRKRMAILTIKNEVARNPKYRKEITSKDIYEAVLKKGIKDLEGFKKYLKELGKEF